MLRPQAVSLGCGCGCGWGQGGVGRGAELSSQPQTSWPGIGHGCCFWLRLRDSCEDNSSVSRAREVLGAAFLPVKEAAGMGQTG